MIGDHYWSTGVSVKHEGVEVELFDLSVDFFDGGFCEDGSTEGKIRVRYMVPLDKVEAELRVLLADAKRLGIEFRADFGSPFLYYERKDGERPCAVLGCYLIEIAKRFGLQASWDPDAYSVPDEVTA